MLLGDTLSRVLKLEELKRILFVAKNGILSLVIEG
jgi:hypothetical protein